LAGSLNKIWPWKETLTTRIKHAGQADEQVLPFIQGNVLPWNYSSINAVESSQLELTVKDPHLLLASGLVILGFGLIWTLEKCGPEQEASA
jgi:putative membrane protein